MVVLSLFDGISGARVALERAGIKVDKYYSSEIDKYAIQVSQKNYPNIIRLGDVTKWKTWDIEKPDLIIGGSPCQGFSFAGKQLNFNDIRSKLFFEFVNILKHYNPDKFLLENVRMKEQYEDVITDLLETEPILINSALVSAQNRQRLYWCNWKVKQPEDRGILLKDILQDGSEKIGAIRGRYKINGKRQDYKQKVVGLTKQELEIRKDNKSNTLTTVQKDNIVIAQVSKQGKKFDKFITKSHSLMARDYKGFGNQGMTGIGCIEIGKAENIKGFDIIKRIYSDKGKSPTLSTCQGGHREPKIAIDDISWRKLTPLECERLQTYPDNYTDNVSNTQRYKSLGNSFTVDVISHILSSINEPKKSYKQGKLW
jgi:DNA (cytosine-5)-methyltransferase 3A